MDLHPNALISTLSCEDTTANPAMPPEHIETDSVSFHRIHRDLVDSERLLEVFNPETPEAVFRQTGWEPMQDYDEVQEYIEWLEQEWREGWRFEYVVETEDGEYAGTTYFARDDSPEDRSFVLGLWLDQPYWGQNISGRRADAVLHVLFNELDAIFVDVGCLEGNQKSRSAIEKYVRRYNGVFTGTQLVERDHYYGTEPVPALHHEYAITEQQFRSHEAGLGTTIPGISYE